MVESKLNVAEIMRKSIYELCLGGLTLTIFLKNCGIVNEMVDEP